MAGGSEADRIVAGADRPIGKVEGEVQCWPLELVVELQSGYRNGKRIL